MSASASHVHELVFGVIEQAHQRQVGFIFPVAGMQGYLNLKAYAEFDNANRPDGWNVWVTFVLSPAPAGAERLRRQR